MPRSTSETASTPVSYDNERGIWLPGDNRGSVNNFNPNITFTPKIENNATQSVSLGSAETPTAPDTRRIEVATPDETPQQEPESPTEAAPQPEPEASPLEPEAVAADEVVPPVTVDPPVEAVPAEPAAPPAEAPAEPEPAVPAETEPATPAAETAETEGNHEAFRREYINPENILPMRQELPEKIDRLVRSQVAPDMTIQRLRELDPWRAKGLEEEARNALLFEYFRTIDRGAVPEDIRNDVIGLLGLSEWTLQNLMLRPEGEEPVAPAEAPVADEPEPTPTIDDPLIDEPDLEDIDETGNAAPGRFRRMWNRVVGIATGRHLYEYMVGRTITAEQQGGRRRRFMNRYTGMLAMAGVGAGLYYLFDRHGNDSSAAREHLTPGSHGGGAGVMDGSNTFPNKGVNDISSSAGTYGYTPETGGAEHLGAASGSSGTGAAAHEHAFNAISGHRYDQSILPDNLDQHTRGVVGGETIVDKNTGQVLVDHVTYKDSGGYSKDTIRQLHEAGYKTHNIQNPIYDTDGGPGPTGQVTGRYTTVVET